MDEEINVKINVQGADAAEREVSKVKRAMNGLSGGGGASMSARGIPPSGPQFRDTAGRFQSQDQYILAQYKAAKKDLAAQKMMEKAKEYAAGGGLPGQGKGDKGDKGDGGGSGPSGVNMATRTFALMPVVRAMLVGGPAVAVLLSALLFIQQALMIGMSGLMKMIGALAKVIGMIVKPIFDILMIALLPLLYLLMPFIKTMNLIFAPLRKRLMEKIKGQLEGGMDPTDVFDWANMGLLLFEAIGGIFTTIIGSLVESIAKGLVGLVGIISPEAAAGLQSILDFIGDIISFSESTLGRDNIDILTGAIVLLGLAALATGVTSIPKLIASLGLLGLGNAGVGAAAAGGAGTGLVAGATGIVTWIVTGICGAIAGVLALLPAVAGLGIAAAGIAALIVGSIVGALAYEFVPGAATVFNAVSGFINTNLIEPFQRLVGLKTWDDLGWGSNSSVKSDGDPDKAARNKAGYDAYQAAAATAAKAALSPAQLAALPLDQIAAQIAELQAASATGLQTGLTTHAQDQIAAKIAALQAEQVARLSGAGGAERSISTRETLAAEWDAQQAQAAEQQIANAAAQQARFEQAMADWATVNAEFTESNRPGMTPQTIMENITGWGSTPAGQKILDEYYAKYPELIGILDAAGPTLEMFREYTATAGTAISSFSSTMVDGTVLVANSLAELQAKIDAFNAQVANSLAELRAKIAAFNAQLSGGGAGGAGATGGYEGYNPTGMVHIANPAGGFFGMFPAGSEFNPGTGQIDVPGAATGGYVRRTGVALIHEGENIVPAGSGGGGNVNINFSGSFSDDLKRELRDFMEEYMRDQLTRRGS